MKSKSLLLQAGILALCLTQVTALSIQQKLLAFSKNLLHSGAILLEEAIPAPHTLVDATPYKPLLVQQESEALHYKLASDS
jgi:hypothetical protein